MNDGKYLKEIINGRTVAMCLQGKSIEQLEDRITELKDVDICWTSLGVFDIVDTYILAQIDKTLDIVFDCASVPHARIPHYEKYMELINNEDKNTADWLEQIKRKIDNG
mgnify:CR=1 FL=1